MKCYGEGNSGLCVHDFVHLHTCVCVCKHVCVGGSCVRQDESICLAEPGAVPSLVRRKLILLVSLAVLRFLQVLVSYTQLYVY